MAHTEIKNALKEPATHISIAAWLSVSNAQEAASFYQSALGASIVYKLEAPDGTLMVARLVIGISEFWVGEASAEETPGAGPVPVRMILTVPDPDTFFAQTLKAGASEIFPVGEEHGWRLGRISDPFGHHWEIGHPVAG
jgi:PhnB protein